MFKKPVKVSAQNQLSGKDKKVIKSKIQGLLDSDCIQKILAANEKMICCKISGAKLLIYNGDEYPLLVDGTGKHNYFPSLYTATAYQPLIKTLTINQGVETYIYNGANLMWPGVRDSEALGEFLKDQTVGIRNSKGQIIAIGAMGCSKKQLADGSGVAVYILHYLGDKLWEMGPKTFPQVIIPLKAQLKLQQLKIQQPIKEESKKQQPKKQQAKKTEQKAKKQQQTKQPNKKKQKSPSPQPKPKKPKSDSQSSDDDVDFMNLVHQKNAPKGRVIKMQEKSSMKNAFLQDQNEQRNAKNKKKPQKQKPKGKGKKQQSQEEEDVMEQEEETQNKKNKKDSKKGGKKKGGKEEKKTKKRDSSSQEENQAPQKKPKKKQENSEEEKQEKGEQKSAINSKLMDEYFKESMLNAIKLTKVEAQLPIDSGKFYMDYMLLARPQGVKLDIKQSSYKKIGKFFEDMAKKKIIEYKLPKDKKSQGTTIAKIFWENEELKNHVPTVKRLASKEQQQKVETYSKAKLKLSKTATLQTVYKPSQDLFKEIMKKPLNLMPAQGEKQVTDNQQIDFVTQKQLRQKIQRYINKVVDGNKEKQGPKKVEKTILIDYNKYQFLKNLLKKEIEEIEENKQKDEILKAQQNSDQEGDKKKKKNKKGTGKQLLKIDRNYLAEKLMKKASPYYHLCDKENDLDRFKQGTFKGVQLTAEKVANKNVTRIIGLDIFITPKTEADDQIHGFANTLQLKFACSVNVQNLPGKNAGKQIIVHGAFLDQLQEILSTEYELPIKFITTLNKLDKKKKT